MKAIIIEDEKISREILRNYLKTYCPSVDLMGEANNIDEGGNLIQQHQPDVIFLDIEMPYGNGFDLLARFDDIDFEVIFITAFSDYAIRAINLSAAYYILKPIDIDELVFAVEKIAKKLNSPQTFSPSSVLQANIKSLSNKDQRIVLPQMDGFEVVQIKDIIRLEAADNYSIFYMADGKKYTLSKTLKYYEDLLVEFGFLRSHKSHLINLAQVAKYKKGKMGQVIFSDDSTALVSPNAKKELMAYFAK
ncbi:LytR/AlgR family response regulator transcription factor [Crocinitomix catalasitica]|uniref:LytR/AlgR family response regulator transcription factor n=1 Tax=Crocinitomix catalasitica TaxID=184607 RepID=UPI001FDF1121|nr:LytTR family DNA-binding domain-containing protein [Crocinitomix catalasitica]